MLVGRKQEKCTRIVCGSFPPAYLWLVTLEMLLPARHRIKRCSRLAVVKRRFRKVHCRGRFLRATFSKPHISFPAAAEARGC